MTDLSLIKKVVRYAKKRGLMAVVKVTGEGLVAILHNRKGRQFYICASGWKELIHKVKCTA